ncbi:MAG: hypothetical protein ACLQU3_24105 [Limisphaerales bacterium]
MKTSTLLSVAFAAGFAGGCSKTEPSAPAKEVVHRHEHKPPHGGAPVELGQEEYHVEFVLDAPEGKLQAFVMDGELENFVRIDAPSVEITAQVSGQQEQLRLHPVANNATGEKVGDTSLFEARADWLKATSTFDAVLKEITVHGKSYTNILFNFPKGNDDKSKK